MSWWVALPDGDPRIRPVCIEGGREGEMEAGLCVDFEDEVVRVQQRWDLKRVGAQKKVGHGMLGGVRLRR